MQSTQHQNKHLKEYTPYLSASLNRKGVLDIDTVKGVSLGWQNTRTVDVMGFAMPVKLLVIMDMILVKALVAKSIVILLEVLKKQ